MHQQTYPTDRLMQLDALFTEVRTTILDRQHPVSGLLPASTAVNGHGDYTDAWVRDNVYSIISAWALGMAYRHVDSADARAYELEQSTIKNMRGLLAAMMRQADRIERFKSSNQPIDALHAKYNTANGESVVGDAEWGHLQLDATSLFVLMLVQMTLSGLAIIATRDEVDFVQNLVWYLSRTYSTPDYGIWERGNKINHGQPELNASSLGMVLAALQAVDGFDLFGSDGDAHTRIFVLADDIARTEMTLNALLPRESGSKEVDAALLSIIGFPAFAVRAPALVKTIDQSIQEKLTGRFGCKRFLRDGHQTVIEDEESLHYEPEELEQFANIESEWPLFFTYQLINHWFAGKTEAAEQLNHQLMALAVIHDDQRLLPELYYVTEADIDNERSNPGSSERVANENLPLVWAQSLWVVGRLLLSGAIDINDLDPINRRRHSNNQVISRAVSIALVAETATVDHALTSMGSNKHTLVGASKVRISSVWALVENLADLGANRRLRLSGRPRRRALGLSTAKVYEIDGQQWLIVPQLFDTDDFYLTQDLTLLVQELRSMIEYLHRYWRQPGRPILTLMISDWMVEAPDFEVLLHFMRDELNRGLVDGVPVRTDRIDALVSRSHRRRLPGTIKAWAQQPPTPSLTPDTVAINPQHIDNNASTAHLTDDELLQQFFTTTGVNKQLDILMQLAARHPKLDLLLFNQTQQQSTLAGAIDTLFQQAQRARAWGAMRRSAELLGKVDAYLDVALMDLLVRQKRLAVGRSYTRQALITEPLSNRDILSRIRQFCNDDPRERILTQELIIHLGSWIRAEPNLFTDVITLRIGPLLQTLIALYAREHEVPPSQAFDALMEESPSSISGRLRDALSWRDNSSQLESLRHVDGLTTLDTVVFRAEDNPESSAADWFQWRCIEGAIGRLPETFYSGVWQLLAHTPALVIGDRYNPSNTLDSALYRSQSTAGEKDFAVAIEHILNRIVAPEYRELVIEALQVLIQIVNKNPALQVKDALIIDVLIGHAVRLACQLNNPTSHNRYDEFRDQAWSAFYQRPPHQVAYFITEALETLLGMGEPHTPSTEEKRP